MNKIIGRIFLCGWLLVWGPLTEAATPRAAGDFFFDQTLGDFSEELATAHAQGKKGILLMFEQDECPFCRRMEQTVLNQPAIQDWYKQHFLIFPIDIEGDVEITDFTGNPVSQKDFAFKQFRVRATPVFAFFDLQGNLIARYTGATRDAEEFRWLGEYVVEGVFQQQSFTRYKRQRKQQTSVKP